MLHFIPPTAAGLLISKVFGPTVDKPSSGVQRAELSKVILAQFAKNLKSSKAGLLGGTSMAMALSACGGGRSDSGNGAVDKPLNISSEATGTRLFSFDTLTENADVALSSANAVDLQTSNIQNLNITTTDGASVLKSLSGDSLETVTIAGDQDVTIENFADATNPNIDIDASELKGDLQAVLSSRGNSNVVGGIGDDVITILGNFNSGVYSDNEQINALANNTFLEFPDEFGGGQIDLIRTIEGTFSLGDGNDKIISYGALSSNALTLEGVETLEIHSLFTTNSFFLQNWGGNEIIFAGSQDHTLRIQIVEDIATGEYITDIDLSMINVAQGNLNIEIYGPPGITLDADYDVSEVNVINPSSSQVEVEVFDGNREFVVEPSDVIFVDDFEGTIQIAENALIDTIVIADIDAQLGAEVYSRSPFSLLPPSYSSNVHSREAVDGSDLIWSLSGDFMPVYVSAIAQLWGDGSYFDSNSGTMVWSDGKTYQEYSEYVSPLIVGELEYAGAGGLFNYNITITDPDYDDYDLHIAASTFQIHSTDIHNNTPLSFDGYDPFEPSDLSVNISLVDRLDYETQQEYTIPLFIVDVQTLFPLYTYLRFEVEAENFQNFDYGIPFDTAYLFRDYIEDGTFFQYPPTLNISRIEVPIIILNVDEVAPIITSADTVSIGANYETGVIIYTATSTDNEDISEGIAYSITEGGNTFSVNPETGAVTINTELEAGEYSFTVKATDGENNSTDSDGVETSQHIKTITVNVTETDTTPPIISNISSITLAENAPLQTTVATVTASDNGGAVTYSIDESSPNIFAIDSLSGVITLTAGLDYETDQQYSISVVATDPAGNEAESPISIIVDNVDEAAPTIVAGNTIISISEDTVAGLDIIAPTTNDDDDVVDGETASLTYSLVGANRSDFDINEETGAITVGAAGLDFETTPEYSLQVRVTDQAGNFNVSSIININVDNVDEAAPTIVAGNTTISISEDTVAGSPVNIALTTNDDDEVLDGETASLTYSLVGENRSDFVINEETGGVSIGTAGLDFETTPEYSLQVRVTDQAENISETGAIVITVIDIVEGNPPVITSSENGTLTSPVPAANVGDAIYIIAADDSDNTANELTYSISNNPGSIRVDSATGEIFLNASPGFPVSFDMDEITFDATVADPGGLFDTESITIEILTADTGGWG